MLWNCLKQNTSGRNGGMQYRSNAAPRSNNLFCFVANSSAMTNIHHKAQINHKNIPLQENTAFLYMHRQLLDSQQAHAFLSAS